jgi:hypothetical protein
VAVAFAFQRSAEQQRDAAWAVWRRSPARGMRRRLGLPL